ncbi:MAG: dihydroxy-acid dehydratase, partial [Opitutaceae bacterium]|nr:dihydroxy-acid dehydratase [Opitutaceae bacterium]
LTDGRFSGVSTGPCIGHISPEAWAGGPLGKLRDGDRLRIRIDTRKLEGAVDFVPAGGPESSAAAALAARPTSEKLRANPDLPADTELWAALQSVSGGSWGGCVYDTARIKQLLAQATSS